MASCGFPDEVSNTATARALMPDHFTAMPAPNATPAANLHGRHNGDGTRGARRVGSAGPDASVGSAGPSPDGGGVSTASLAAVRRSIQRRSSTRHRNPSTTQNSKWTSSIAMRDITTLSPSIATIAPATNVQTVLANNSCASRATITATRVPLIAEGSRHPKASMPNALIPMPVIHLPSGGCTHEPMSHLFSTQ